MIPRPWYMRAEARCMPRWAPLLWQRLRVKCMSADGVVDDLDRTYHEVQKSVRFDMRSEASMGGITEFVGETEQDSAQQETLVDQLRFSVPTPGLQLSNFLERPIQIAQLEWAVGDIFRLELFPWKLFLNHPTIRSKLENYAYIHGELCVKAVLNASPFHYGLAVMSYRPMSSEIEPFIGRPASTPLEDNIRYTQRHHILLDPNTSSGGTLELPFIYDKDVLPMTEDSDMERMGMLTLNAINFLRTAQGSTESVTITLFAHMKNAVLSGSTVKTTVEPASFMRAEAGVLDAIGKVNSGIKNITGQGDEYGTGIVSRPASAIARFANELSTHPRIGPFATATSMVAETAGRVSHIFGFSRPPDLTPPRRYRPTVAGVMANTEGEEAADVLTLDPKCEITIDSKAIGCGPDDAMSISHIVTRPSYLTQWGWTELLQPGQRVFSLRIHPLMFATNSNASPGNNEHHMLPMGWLQHMFSYWRGTIEVTVQVVCSNFHRGRLRIHYDPIVGAPTGVGVPMEWAGGYSRILDISQEREFTMKIAMQQPTSYLYTRRINSGSPEQPFTVSNSGIVPSPGIDNGVFSIEVLNKLTAPESPTDNDISVNIWVKGGDDLEFCAPYDNFQQLSVFSEATQAVAMRAEADVPSSEDTISSVPIQSGEGKMTLAPVGNPDEFPQLNLIYMGETIKSLSSLLTRYAYHTSLLADRDPVSLPVTWIARTTRFPLYRGYDPTGFDTAGTFSEPANLVKNTPLNYLTPGFLAYRGGIRRKAHYIQTKADGASPDDNAIMSKNIPFLVKREAPSQEPNAFLRTSYASLGTGNAYTRFAVDRRTLSTWEGAALTSSNQNNVLEFACPYYRNVRFQEAQRPTKDDLSTDLVTFQTELAEQPAFNFRIATYVAASHDFRLMYFLNAPVLYYFAP